MPKAPLDEIVHRSELVPPTFGDMALGGADFTVVSFTPLLVTVDVVFWLMVLSSALTTVGITNVTQNTATTNPAIKLFLSLSDITYGVSAASRSVRV